MPPSPNKFDVSSMSALATTKKIDISIKNIINMETRADARRWWPTCLERYIKTGSKIYARKKLNRMVDKKSLVRYTAKIIRIKIIAVEMM
jgi:hypothetical protein